MCIFYNYLQYVSPDELYCDVGLPELGVAAGPIDDDLHPVQTEVLPPNELLLNTKKRQEKGLKLYRTVLPSPNSDPVNHKKQEAQKKSKLI